MTEILKPFREKIDSLDAQLVTLLVEREKIVHQVAKVKKEHDIPIVLPERIEEILNSVSAQAIAQGGSENYMREIYKRLIDLSCALEDGLIHKESKT